MKRPAFASVVVFGAVFLVTAVIVAAVGIGTDGASAIEVGDEKVSRESMNDELRTWAEFDPDNFRTTNAAVDSELGTQVVTQRVWELLGNDYLARTGEQVTAADRASVREQIQGARFQELPERFQEVYLDRLAVFAAITRLVGDENDPNAELDALRREAQRVGVSVDPVYGRWAPADFRVVPVNPPAARANQP